MITLTLSGSHVFALPPLADALGFAMIDLRGMIACPPVRVDWLTPRRERRQTKDPRLVPARVARSRRRCHLTTGNAGGESTVGPWRTQSAPFSPRTPRRGSYNSRGWMPLLPSPDAR